MVYTQIIVLLLKLDIGFVLRRRLFCNQFKWVITFLHLH